MKILIIGGGGREHAIAWRLNQEKAGHTLFCAPGNAGTAGLAKNLPISAEDLDSLVAWAADNRPDLTVVGPEVPLCAGLSDRLGALGLCVFGPSRAAAQIEGSKQFAKDIMAAANVPTARSERFTDEPTALAALDRFALPVVIKADGLAAGKGVIICASRDEAVAAIREMLVEGVFGQAGRAVLIEAFLQGEEASILALVDGERIAMLPSAQDHKRVFDADRGPNTGAWARIRLLRWLQLEVSRIAMERVFKPVVAELSRRGICYRGVLYAGLMIGADGLRVLEFNCRFGDPETQVVLPRLKSDLSTLLMDCANGRLDPAMLKVEQFPCVTIVMASEGLSGTYPKNCAITGLAEAAEDSDVVVFHAGTVMRNNDVVTSGGRVLGVTAWGSSMRDAVDRAYAAAGKSTLRGAHFRRDIARRAFDRR